MVENEIIIHSPVTEALAASGSTGARLGGGAVQVGLPPDGRQSYTYKEYIEAIYSFSIDLGTSLAALMIVYAGYKYLTSSGNQSAVNDAKDIITGALLGLAMLMLIKFILNYIGLPDLEISGPRN